METQKSIYPSLQEWKKNCPNGYRNALQKELLPKLCETFGWKWKLSNKKPHGYWNEEICFEDAKKYNSLSEWKNNNRPSYHYASKKKLLPKICEKFGWKLSKMNFWTKELCLEEAKKCTTKKEWKLKSQYSYATANKNNWLQECASHMVELHKPAGYWTKEMCIEDAKKYNSKGKWQLSSKNIYGIAWKNNWLIECCVHMSKKNISSDYWTKEHCIEEARKYTTKQEWFLKCRSAYVVARKNKWLIECCGHLSELKRIKGYWTKERCTEDAKKYGSRNQWDLNSRAAFSTAYRNKWLDDCCSHMVLLQKPRNFWTKEKCIEDAQNYHSKIEWGKNSSGYGIARNYGWIQDCCAHMVELKVSNGYWTKELCMEDAKKYTSRTQWQANSRSAYVIACRNKWLQECYSYMVDLKNDG